MTPLVPAYGRRSLADVLPAVLSALDVPGRCRAELSIPPAKAVALLLVDGLGSDLLHAHASDAPYLSSLPDAGPLTAGFPSSTSISLTSLGTGLPPGAHGMLGMSFRAPGGTLLDTLQWRAYGVENGADLRESMPPEELQPAPTALQHAVAAGITTTVVSKREFKDSGLTRAALRGGTFRGALAMGDLAAEMVTAVSGPGKRFCYGYHADLDMLGHIHGPGSLPWRLQLNQVDTLAALITENMPAGTLLAITGDHGMVGVDRTVDADVDADLQRGVAAIAGDPRARHVYAEKGAADDVLAAWEAVLAGHAWVVSREQAIEERWFGPVSPRMRGRIGDVVVATKGRSAVIRSRAEPQLSRLPGQHGSLTSAEQHVPLLLAHAA